MPFKIAVSGIRASQTELSVIGNNVANVGTTGFKGSRTEFQDVYALSNLGVADNSPGKGVNVSRVAQQFTQGNITFTDNSLDLAISGAGFFQVEDNGSTLYSRDGSFAVDREGYVVNASGQRLKVFGADDDGNILGSTESFRVNNSNIPPVATSTIEFGLNLDAQAEAPSVSPFDPANPDTYNNSTSATVYDSLGGAHLVQTYYVKDGATPQQWDSYTYIDGQPIEASARTLTFDATGALSSANPTTLTAYTFPPGSTGEGAEDLALTVDYGDTTQFGDPFGVNAITQNGFPTGRLASLDVDPQGVIFARFTNGQSLVQGQVALATFANPQGLQPVGGNSWQATFAAGEPLEGTPGSSTLGLIQSGALEDSNVDLSSELVKLIVAQRNFQANTEVISTADAVTQSIINIR